MSAGGVSEDADRAKDTGLTTKEMEAAAEEETKRMEEAKRSEEAVGKADDMAVDKKDADGVGDGEHNMSADRAMGVELIPDELVKMAEEAAIEEGALYKFKNDSAGQFNTFHAFMVNE